MSAFVSGPIVAQYISSITIPPVLCDGEDFEVHFGTTPSNEVMIVLQESTLGHSETIFLPDGVPCDGKCAYESPVKFASFKAGDTIRSANDIVYLRINMEHSYIGDVYIKIECPNGKKADLMRFAGTGESECKKNIPYASRSWLAGNNMPVTTFLGKANDYEDEYWPCDVTSPLNAPGKGWNYCWSNCQTAGITYSSGDGIIYRKEHQHKGIVDSSDVQNKSNYYHPDEHFNSLVGCPLNGEWKVTVIDGYSMDNGYIFEWELSLDASLLPPLDCMPKSYAVLGGDTKQMNDSSFLIHAPDSLAHDTTITYIFRMVTTCGDTIDSAASISYHHIPEGWAEDKVCGDDPYIIEGQTVYGGGEHTVSIPMPDVCDSIVHLFLTEYPKYDMHFYDSICINRHTLFDGQQYSEQGNYAHRYTTQDGCDSVLTLHLTVTDQELKARIRAIPPVVDIENPNLRLYDESQHHVARRWTIGSATSDASSIAMTYPIEEDSLQVILTAISKHNCADTDTVTIHLDRTLASIPNVFTPNQESNNRWRPIVYGVKEQEVWLYNRTGQLVAHLTDIDEAWDGTSMDGSPCPQGTYVYMIEYRTLVRPDEKKIGRGSVTLIR